MAYDRYDSERGWREGRGRRDEDRLGSRYERPRGRYDEDRGRDERGFFERMGDEVRSFFSDEDSGGRRGRDEDDRDWRRERSHGGEDWRREQSGGWRDSDRDERSWRGREQDERSGDYRPMTGDYGRFGREDERDRRGDSEWERDPYRRSSYAGSSLRSSTDPHYEEMRRRRMEELDREYEEYHREHREKFHADFGSWRERRQSKRQLLSQIREHMEVVGKDEKHVGTVDRVAGDRIVLTKSDPEAGGVHHSLSCTDVDRVEENRVILEIDADKARERWRDEQRSRALFEREDQGEAGPHMLDRSFSGTYRR